MDAVGFLRLVVADLPHKVVAVPIGRGYRHIVVDTFEEMVRVANAYAKKDNVYYALGTLREKHVWVDTKDGQKKSHRVKNNIAALKTLWIDIDVGAAKAEKGKGYATFDEGVAALDAFVADTGLPSPLIIASGGGIHAYWPFTEPATQEEWEPVAAKLKALTVAHGLINDRQMIANSAAVLRIVGTINYKYDTPVTVYDDIMDEHPLSDLNDMLSAAIIQAKEKGLGTPAIKLTTRKVDNVKTDSASLVESLHAHTPACAEKIFQKCPQIRHICDTDGAVDEPTWYAVVQLARHTDEGLDFAKSLSSKAERYESLFVQKHAQLEAKNIGPTLCAKFEELNPHPCRDCSYRGKISSPIQLGRVVEALPPPRPGEDPLVVQKHDSGQAYAEVALREQPAPKAGGTPDPAKPFTRARDGLYIEIANEEGDDFQHKFYEWDLFPTYRYRDEAEKTDVVRFIRRLPNDGEHEFDIKLEHVVDQRALFGVLAKNGVIVAQENKQHMAAYVMSYIKQLQAQVANDLHTGQFGWNDTATTFTTGLNIYGPNGVISKATPGKGVKEIARGLHSAGTLANWKRGVSIFSRPGMEPFLFAFLTGFGSPLMRFTPYAGGTICIWGETGAGKTTAMQGAISVWGSPSVQDGLIASLNSTENAYYKRMSVMYSLPVCIDEITNMSTEARGRGKDVSQFCYSVSDGHEPDRCKSNNGVVSFADRGNWRTIVLTTSNQSLHAKLSLAKSNAAAEILRVIDYPAPTKVLPKQDADQHILLMQENYGLAGEHYAEYLGRASQSLRKKIPEFIAKFEAEVGAKSEERFWTAMIVCNLMGARIANDLGLIRVDVKALKDWAVNLVLAMRANRTQCVSTCSDVIADYIGEHLRNMIAVRDSGQRSRKDIPLVGNVTVMPTAAPLVLRYEEDTGWLYIHKKHFRDYTLRKQFNPAQIMDWLVEQKLLVNRSMRVNLAKGSTLPAMQQDTFVINVRNPVFSLVADMGETLKTASEV